MVPARGKWCRQAAASLQPGLGVGGDSLANLAIAAGAWRVLRLCCLSLLPACVWRVDLLKLYSQHLYQKIQNFTPTTTAVLGHGVDGVDDYLPDREPAQEGTTLCEAWIAPDYPVRRGV